MPEIPKSSAVDVVAGERGGAWLLARFVLVGVLNTAFSYGVYAAMLWLGLSYWAASLISMLMGVVFSFRTQGQLVFGNSSWRLFGRFVLVWLFILAFNLSLIGGLIRLGMDAYGAGAVALIPVVGLSFLAQRFIVFRPASD